MLKIFLQWLLTFIYKVEITGLDNYKKAGKRVLIVANHTSFLDPLLLGVFLPDDITFAISTQMSQRWWLKPFLRLSRVFPMDPTHPLSLKDLIHYLENDSKTVIFPEGRISVTGSLMKIYDGTGMVADKSEAAVLPVRISGAQYTHFSKLHRIVRLRFFPKITIQILPPRQISAPENLRGKARRTYCGHLLADIMTKMMFLTSPYRQTIFTSLLEARRIHGGSHRIAEDLERIPLTYNDLITRSIVIGNEFIKITASGENVGIFLPNSTKTLITILALQLHGRVPAMLNFSTGSAGMLSACQIAQVKTVLTSRRFIELADLSEEAGQLSNQCRLVYLEDLAKNISTLDKFTALLKCKIADYWYKHEHLNPDNPAVILYFRSLGRTTAPTRPSTRGRVGVAALRGTARELGTRPSPTGVTADRTAGMKPIKERPNATSRPHCCGSAAGRLPRATAIHRRKLQRSRSRPFPSRSRFREDP